MLLHLREWEFLSWVYNHVCTRPSHEILDKMRHRTVWSDCNRQPHSINHKLEHAILHFFLRWPPLQLSSFWNQTTVTISPVLLWHQQMQAGISKRAATAIKKSPLSQAGVVFPKMMLGNGESRSMGSHADEICQNHIIYLQKNCSTMPRILLRRAKPALRKMAARAYLVH